MSDQLLRLRQGASSTNEYTLPFRTLAATRGWNEVAFLSAYRHGLDPRICAQMAIYNYFGLESFMQKANRISHCLSAYHSTEATHQSVSPATGLPVPELMQVDSTRFSHDEHARRLATGLCLYCAATDHYNGAWPIRPSSPAVSTIQSDPVISMLPVQLFTPAHSVTASALINSGSSGNFISKDLLIRLHLPCRHHAQEPKPSKENR